MSKMVRVDEDTHAALRSLKGTDETYDDAYLAVPVIIDEIAIDLLPKQEQFVPFRT